MKKKHSRAVKIWAAIMTGLLYLAALVSLTVAFTPTAQAAIALVQATSSASAAIGVNTTTASQAWASSITAHDFLAVYARWQANTVGKTSSISSITDTQGDTFFPAFPASYDVSSSPAEAVQVWYALNAIGGNSTATVTFSTSTNGNGVREGVMEFSGLATSSALDVATTSVTLAASTTFYSGFITTTKPNELLLGGFSAGSSHTGSAGAGWTNLIPTPVTSLPYYMEYKIVSSTGLYQATGTYTAAADFNAFIFGVSASSTATSSAVSIQPPLRSVVTFDW